jgi:hypothetical protein
MVLTGVEGEKCYEVDCRAGRGWFYVFPFRVCDRCGIGVEAYMREGEFSIRRVWPPYLGPGLQTLC